MGNLVKKGMAALVGVALISAAGLAQAETRFAVQDPTGITDKMVVTDKGYIGVGTDAPKTAIQSKGNSYESTQILSHYTGTVPWESGGFMAYRNNLGVDGTTPILPKRNDRIGYTLFGSFAADGTQRNGGALVGYAESDWTSTSIPTFFLFETAGAGTTARTEKMRLTSTGNFGIGTQVPTQKLHVNGAIRMTTPDTAVKPAASSAVRGVIWLTQGGVGVADLLEVCVKDANGNYSWVKLN
jgi:hypothetical protein